MGECGRFLMSNLGHDKPPLIHHKESQCVAVLGAKRPLGLCSLCCFL